MNDAFQRERKTVVICGRPNVGKSSLFNRLIGKRRAIVLDTPGVTRDRILEPTEWWISAKPYALNVIDTGGLGEGQFEQEIKRQVETAFLNADLILFMMDIRAGLTHADEAVLLDLRRSGLKKDVPWIGVLNKVDDPDAEIEMSEFYATGLEHFAPVSAEHNLGIEELKERIVDLLGMTGESSEEAAAPVNDATDEPEERQRRTPCVAIVGQPNVGKSTLLNAICGEPRSIVSNIAGTTVDSIDTQLERSGKPYVLVDTAGIRRKNKTEDGIEVLSVVQTKKALERADVAVLVMDGEKGVYDQDEKIAGLIEEAGCSVVLVLNKWDTQKTNEDFNQPQAEEQIRSKIRFLNYAPLVFTTAKEGLGIDRLFRMIEHVLEQRTLKLSTKELTEFVRMESEVHNPKNAKFYMVNQVGRHPPSFVAKVNDPRKVDFSLERHLIKAIRMRWGYLGTPIRFHFTKAKNN